MSSAAGAPHPHWRSAAAVTVVGLAGLVVAAFLPWVASGGVERTSFETVRSAQRLGLAESSWQGVMLDGWYLLPLLGALALLALALHRVVLATAIALVAGLVALGAGLVVVLAPVSSRSGPVVAIVMGALTVGGAAWLLRVERQTA